MMKPKILHVSVSRLSSGGVERFLIGLSRSLHGYFEFALLSGADEILSKQLRDLDWITYNWGVKHTLDVSASKKLREVIGIFSPDIVHFHDARARLISVLGIRKNKARTVYTVHLPPYYYRWQRFSRLRRFNYAMIERFLNHHYTDMVVFPSHSGWLYASQHNIMDERKAACIPNGIDVQQIYLPGMPMHHKHGMPIICSVARLSPEKNVGLLLEAAAVLKQKQLLFNLWIVGDGPERLSLQSQAGALGIGEITWFWGRQETAAPFLRDANVFALASWYEGGRSQAAMEAQVAGLPCVLSNVGDNALMVEDGRGIVFPEGDLSACVAALEYLLQNRLERIAMGSNAQKYAMIEYDIRTMAASYSEIYRKILGN